jgi:cell division protein FtsL
MSDDEESQLESQYLDTKIERKAKQAPRVNKSINNGNYSLEEINSSLLEELEEKEQEIEDLRKQVEDLTSSLSGIGSELDDNTKDAKILALAKKVRAYQDKTNYHRIET